LREWHLIVYFRLEDLKKLLTIQLLAHQPSGSGADGFYVANC
jgi:hypothetical protein